MREKVIDAIKYHYGLSNPDDTAYRLGAVEALADRILAIPEIESGIALYLASIEERD